MFSDWQALPFDLTTLRHNFASRCRDMLDHPEADALQKFVQQFLRNGHRLAPSQEARTRHQLHRRRHVRPAALPPVGRQRTPAILSVGFVPASNGVIVQIKKLRDDLARLPVIQQKDRIGPTRNTVILPLAS